MSQDRKPFDSFLPEPEPIPDDDLRRAYLGVDRSIEHAIRTMKPIHDPLKKPERPEPK